MKNYLQRHLLSAYLPETEHAPGVKRFANRNGWHDYYIGDKLIFSHRETIYDSQAFPEKLHTHDFFEMDIYLNGNIRYIADNCEFIPARDDILIFPPGCHHTARLMENGTYERLVFYFNSHLVDFLGKDCLPALFRSPNACSLSIEHQKRAEFYYLRERLNDTVHSRENDAAIEAFAYVLQLFHLIANHTKVNRNRIMDIPQKVLDVKHYIDHNFQTIGSIEEVAGHFFYSREYVSRIFKQYFNLNISEHLQNQKIDYAKHLLEQGNSVSFASASAGFKSSSSFISAFKQRTGMTPVEYKKAHKKRK